jgi:hypothetical protein
MAATQRGFSETAPPGLPVSSSSRSGSWLPGVESQRDVVEQRLKRPPGGQVDANATGGFADAALAAPDEYNRSYSELREGSR